MSTVVPGATAPADPPNPSTVKCPNCGFLHSVYAGLMPLLISIIQVTAGAAIGGVLQKLGHTVEPVEVPPPADQHLKALAAGLSQCPVCSYQSTDATAFNTHMAVGDHAPAADPPATPPPGVTPPPAT